MLHAQCVHVWVISSSCSFSTRTAEPQFGSYRQSFVLIKSQHISSCLHFSTVVLYASFCLALDSFLFAFSFQCKQHFNSNQHSDTRISVVLFSCFVAVWRFYLVGFALLYACVYVCVRMFMGVCPCGRYIKMREVHLFFISFCFHILCLAFTCCAISAMTFSLSPSPSCFIFFSASFLSLWVQHLTRTSQLTKQ